MLEMWLSERRDKTLKHSAKGMSWKKHKYIKKLDGTYYYPSWYEGGRHLSPEEENASASQPGQDPDNPYKWELGSTEKGKREHESSVVEDLRDSDIDELARLVIKGAFGNGSVRKELLGEDYARVQSRVNDILLGGKSFDPKQKVLEAKLENVLDKIDNTTLLDAAKTMVESANNAGRTNLKSAIESAMGVGIKVGNKAKNEPRKEERDKKLNKGVNTVGSNKKRG